MMNWFAGEQAVVVVFWVWMTIFTITAPRLIRNLKGIKSTPYYLQIFPAIVYCTVGVAWLSWGRPVVIFAWVASVVIAAIPTWKAGTKKPDKAKLELNFLRAGIGISLVFGWYRFLWLS